MNKDELINDLKKELKNSKTIEDIYAVFFTMLEQNMEVEDMCEVLRDMKLPEEVLKEVSEEVLVR